jgi:uncharacterized protein
VTTICDSSPLILYSRLGRLDLLRDVFSQIIVPPAVWTEVVTEGMGRPGSADIAKADWIHRRSLAGDDPLPTHLAELGEGEAEAIALAMQLEGPTSVVLDDQKARRIAAEYGCIVLGSARVLTLAKELGLIASVGPLLDHLRGVGLYLGDDATREIMSIAGEQGSDADEP